VRTLRRVVATGAPSDPSGRSMLNSALPLRERREASEWGPWSIKAGVTYALAPASALAQVVALRLHLDDSRPDNGPLRVLPGTRIRSLDGVGHH